MALDTDVHEYEQDNEKDKEVTTPDDVNDSQEAGGDVTPAKTPSPADMPNAGKDKEGVEVPADEDEAGGETDSEGVEQVSDTFPRAYVEKLRKENARLRERAKSSDDLAERLHRALVSADGRLADPSDLPFNEEHLEDPELLEKAIADLVRTKPGLRAQKIRGDVGQGTRSTASKKSVDLIDAIRGLS